MSGGGAGRLRLSLVVNTRNEARNLGGLLDSARGVDEIVVADMESSDATLGIARRRGARILPLPNAGCCEPGRQAALDAATGDWLLVLDADERLSPGGVERLRSIAAASPPDVSAFRFAFRVFVGTTRVLRSGWETPLEMHARVFRRGRVRWPAEIHASPHVEGRVVDVPERRALR